MVHMVLFVQLSIKKTTIKSQSKRLNLSFKKEILSKFLINSFQCFYNFQVPNAFDDLIDAKRIVREIKLLSKERRTKIINYCIYNRIFQSF